MRVNFSEGSTLVSTTDLKGRITHGNASFIEVSGFTREECLGLAHNLVRQRRQCRGPASADEGPHDLDTLNTSTPIASRASKSGDAERMLTLMEIEKLMSNVDMGLMAEAGP